jgi:class 3 adenylate cyclase/tetratricopeptide (TPR) repeat protein
MDIAAWLRGLGLEKYAPAFDENAINWDVLSELTTDDLKDIGVAAVGDRRRLLAAIAALGPLANPPLPGLVPGITGEGRVGGEAERRQLTVMFCDLVGSTPLSTRFDPEDLREIVGAYHRCVTDTVGRFGGFVAKYMGDGVLIYFGYPEAHEDDAERAVRGGLAVIDAVGLLAAQEPLTVRIGIATGLVVVGDLIGAGAAQERGVVGETPNLAARLQALARPGTLVVADSTRRQIGTLFEIEDLGPQPLSGFAEPQRAWRVVGESGVVSRFEALRSGTTPLVGRDEELDLLLRRWQQVKSGEGRVVLVSGEPGIGKSRLTAELSQRIASEPHTRLRYFCSPYHENSALYPFITQLERAAGFARDDTAEEKLSKLRALLAPGARDNDEIELLAELLSLPNAAADLNLSPQRKRETLFAALLHQFEALARPNPVLMIFEDSHWIDSTSREQLDLTVERVRRVPVLLVVTFRPEFQHAWSGRPHVTVLAPNRLGERDVAALVRGLARNTPLGSEVVEEIVERTDGVPLFVEELTKAVLERADQDKRVAAVLSAAPLPGRAVPSTLHASLIARLDRIGAAAKEIAQIGAVLGREFSYELIEPVAQRNEGELQAALAQLSNAGLLFCRGTPPHALYLFKHALVQDAAYGTLLRTRRQELHARVAAVLEEHFADLVERQPELLAHHLTAAAEADRAVTQWLKAGQFAASRLAYVEALGHLERGMVLLRSLSASPARAMQEIELQLAIGLCSITVKGMSAAAVGEAYARANELAQERGDDRQLFQALYGLWQHNSGSGRILDARPLSQRLLRVTENATDLGLRLQAHHSAWTTGLLGGDPVNGYKHAEAGIRIYDAEEHSSHRYIYGGHDPGVCARITAAQLQWLLGYPDRAQAEISEALALADRLAHPFSRETTLTYAAMLHLHRGETNLALSQLARAEALAAEQRLSFVMEPLFLRGAALVQQGTAGEAVAVIREGLAPGRPVATIWQPFVLSILAEALRRRGDYQEAHAAIRQGLDTMNASGERMWHAELHRIHGLVQLAENEPEECEASFEEALRVARQQQAKSLELRAATSLARLWGEQARRTEARELLAPVYGWFAEGFDTADLKDAKTLLDQLA